MKSLLVILSFLVSSFCFGQKTITGIVSDDTDDGLLGVIVLVKGTDVSTQTDFDGNYSIEALPEDTLVFSYTGCDTQEVLIGNQNVINVKMTTDFVGCYFPYIPQNQIFINYGVNYKTLGAYFKNNSNFIRSSIEVSYATDFERNNQTKIALEKKIYFIDNFSLKMKASTENADFNKLQYHSYKLQAEKDIRLFGSYDFLQLQFIGGYLNYDGRFELEHYGYGIGLEKKVSYNLNLETSYINWTTIQEYNLIIAYRWQSWNTTISYKHLGSYEELQLGIGYDFRF